MAVLRRSRMEIMAAELEQQEKVTTIHPDPKGSIKKCLSPTKVLDEYRPACYSCPKLNMIENQNY